MSAIPGKTIPFIGFTEERRIGFKTDMESALRRIDALVMASAEMVTALPLSPSDGEVVVISRSATGGLIPYHDHVARYNAATSAWEYMAPTEGWAVSIDGIASKYIPALGWVDNDSYQLALNLADDAAPESGAGLVGYKSRTVAARLGDSVSVRDYSHLVAGNNWTEAFKAAIVAAGTDGTVVIPGGGYEYDIDDTLVLIGTKLDGIGNPVLQWVGVDQNVDFIHMEGGSVEDEYTGSEVIGARLDGLNIKIGPAATMRDFVWLRYGDHAKITDCRLSAGLRPCRDGIRIEPSCEAGNPKTWMIENTKLENVRISRVGRDGIRVAIPSKASYETAPFVNLGTILQCEVRGTSKNGVHVNATDGACGIRFYNACTVADTTMKISQWEIIGGEYQCSPSSNGPTFGIRNQHIDTSKGGRTERVTVVGGTYEKIEGGALYAGSVGVDFSGAIRCQLMNNSIFGWPYTRNLEFWYKGGASLITNGEGFTFDAAKFGSNFIARGVWDPVVAGGTVDGTWTPVFAGGSYYRIGQLVFIQFQLQGTLSGASGVLVIRNLPFTVHNDPSGPNINMFSAGGSIETMEGITFPANYTFATLRTYADVKILTIKRHGSGQNTADVSVSEITGTLKLYGSLVYECRRFEDEDGVTYPKLLWNS